MSDQSVNGEIVRVLDHGFVRLVDHMGGDTDISRAARVSYGAPAREEDDKLIGYLLRNHHTSPFEAVIFTFEVQAPIFVFRQWHRHRTWSYNEVSARYTVMPNMAYIARPEDLGQQSKDNKQARERLPLDDRERSRAYNLTTFMKSLVENAQYGYELLIKEGVPREIARTILPLGTYSRMFATVDLHNLFHFIRLRLHNHAQWEIRVYAEAMLNLIEPHVPLAVKHFRWLQVQEKPE